MIRALLLILALAVPSGAMAQAPELLAQTQRPAIPDSPEGYPYNVGRAYESTQVPLRDYLSSRIDQLRIEILDRIETDRVQNRSIIDERDQRYSQRFQAQQEALNAALQAAKEQVANALAAAKEAVIKAEAAVEKRFENVNEFRAQLDDQADTFMPKAEATVRFNTLEEKVNNLVSRMDAVKSAGEGRNDTWALVVGAIFLIIAIGTFAMNYNRHKAAA